MKNKHRRSLTSKALERVIELSKKGKVKFPNAIVDRTIHMMDPMLLEQHPLNLKYFGEGIKKESELMVEDVRERPIQHAVTVIKIGDRYLILAGTRRTAACQIVGREVPVQFARQDMTEDEQEAFILLDNINTRTLTAENKMQLLENIVPNIMTVIRQDTIRIKKGISPTMTKEVLAQRSNGLFSEREAAIYLKEARRRQGLIAKREKPIFMKNEKENKEFLYKFKAKLEKLIDTAYVENITTQQKVIEVMSKSLKNYRDIYVKKTK